VQDGETGILVPHGNTGALAGALRSVLTDRVRREQLEQNGVRWAATFTWERCADEAFAVLERALGSKQAPGAWPLSRAV
jgi:glycosyltransferase involved in cell wall biosynthesis